MVDFKKLYSIFVDEAMERIAELEDGLLQFEKSSEDKELLNTIFRAAHTIKGSSGSIGLKDISAFTHHMEEILDMVRQEKLSPDKELINTLLDATDMIKEMVGCVASETVFDFGRCEGLLKRMEEIKKSPESGGKSQEIKTFKIIFAPSHDLFKRGIDPAMIIDDLRGIGEIVSIKCLTEAVPALSDMNPENLYLRWDIQLRTDKDASEIKNVFEFVEEGSEIKIFPVSTTGKDVPFIGKMLIDEGVVKAEDVEDALKSQKRLGEILAEQGKVSPVNVEKALEKQRNIKMDSFKKSVSSTIRVDLGKLDHLINIVGEMVIIHSMFQQAIQGGNWLSVTDNGGNGKNGSLMTHNSAQNMEALFSQLQRIGKDIQESAMSLRMLPVGEIFQRFIRLVRELSASKNKDIELIITGEDTELDKGVLEKIADPLVHLIRNSIDHGIETPQERLNKGKPEKGTIHLSAYQMGDAVYIDVEDDGRGLNKEKIVQNAMSKGIITNDQGLTDEQICNLIFMPGFSTADTVTDVSGRGVGMDVVKKNIESLNGKVYIRTRQDTGTTISIKLPLTLAIIDGLTVLIGEEIFVIPITSVVESLRPNRMEVKSLNEKVEVINVRGEYIPLMRLYEILGITSWKKDPWDAIVIVTMHEGRKYGLLADELLGEQQIVIKNLGTATPKVRGIAGGTILGDGRVALVLDVPGIAEMVKKQVTT
ncbi:MAG: chemotaxis protein CheA [Thermodesulfovibrionales bacterium]|jgi:two-component system chemotaxis sensor kinase CheA|nr:chemotaxis protein CheA [Thermodesulfovibrionales bacterium]